MALPIISDQYAIDAAWSEPIRGTIPTSLPGPPEHLITDLVRRTRALQDVFATAGSRP